MRAVTFIKAPPERCFRLSLSERLIREAMSRVGTHPSAATPDSTLLHLGSILEWNGLGRLRALRTCSEVIIHLRPPSLIRRTLRSKDLIHFEYEQHFAGMNDGTRLTNEGQFSLAGGLLRQLRERRMRQAALYLLKVRVELLKEIAEGTGWAEYLPDRQAAAIATSNT